MAERLVKVGGVAAVLGGAVIAAEGVWEIVQGRIHEGRVESAVHSLWVLLLVVALAGLHELQRGTDGRLGRAAAGVALLGTGILFVSSLPEMWGAGADAGGKLPPVMLAVFLVSFVCYVGGLLVFGIAGWWSRTLPRPACALLVVSLLGLMFLSDTVVGTLVPFGIAWIWLGAAVLRGTPARAGGQQALRAAT
jgi:hypothetical protein